MLLDEGYREDKTEKVRAKTEVRQCLSFDQKLGELAPLGSALEGHPMATPSYLES
jgi:hypothetical protein